MIAKRIVWGARWGAVFGLTLCVLALVAFLIGGRATFDGLGTSLGQVLAVYLVGGVTLGIIVGLFRPLTRRPVGAGIVGFAGGLLFGALIRISQDGFSDWTAGDAVQLSIFAAVLGVPVGLVYREIFMTSPPRPRGTGKD